MKNLIIIPLLLVSFLAGLIGQGKTCHEAANYTVEAPSRIVVKGLIDQGVVVPHIVLPEIEITGELDNRKNIVEAIEIDGKLYPSFELETITIIPTI